MSQENVEIVRRALSEFDDLQTLSEAFAPNFTWELRTLRAPGASESYRGWDGFFEFFSDWVGAYEEWKQDIEEILDGGGDRVVVLAHQRGRFRGTKDWVELNYGLVYTVVDGLIRGVVAYSTPEEALEAAGLEE